MSKNKQIISASIDKEVLKKLDETTKKADRSRGWIVNEALKQYLSCA